MSTNDLRAASGQEVNVQTSEHNESASEHSMTVPASSEYSMREVCSYLLKEPISEESITPPFFQHMEGVPSIESISHPYSTKDKDFVNAKSFLLQASTLTGLNL